MPQAGITSFDTEITLSIRMARPDDRTDIIRLFNAQFVEHNLSPSVVPVALDSVDGRPERAQIWVALIEEMVVGVAYLAFTWTLEHGGKSAWLEELYVEPEFRNIGIGTALIRAAMQGAKDVGAKAIDLEVETEHQQAEHLYEREGFTPHTRRHWYRRF